MFYQNNQDYLKASVLPLLGLMESTNLGYEIPQNLTTGYEFFYGGISCSEIGSLLLS
jgi:hypothetical protein